MSKTSSQAGNFKYERRSGKSFKGQVKLFDVLIAYLPNSEKDKARIQQCERNCYKIFLVMFYSGRIWEEDFLIANIEKIGKRWSMKQGISASEIHLRRLNAKEVLTTQRDEEFVLRIPRTHSETGIHLKEESVSAENFMAIRKSFNLKNQRWRRRSGLILVYSRILHILSSYWTEKFNKKMAGKIISYSTELCWCHKRNFCRSGDCTRNELMIIGISQDLQYWMKLLWKEMTNPGGEIDENSDDITSRSYMAWRIDKNWESNRETAIACKRQCSRTCTRETVVPK